jgi:hypothetical protein
MLVYEGILEAGLVDFKTNIDEILELFDEEILQELKDSDEEASLDNSKKEDN